jgi:hypothetical protein
LQVCEALGVPLVVVLLTDISNRTLHIISHTLQIISLSAGNAGV